MTKTMKAWIIAVAIAVALAISMNYRRRTRRNTPAESQEAVFRVSTLAVRLVRSLYGSTQQGRSRDITPRDPTRTSPLCGFMRERSGKITTFIAPGASTTAYPYGTVADAINPEGAITG
jgi:hypothetical protein